MSDNKASDYKWSDKWTDEQIHDAVRSARKNGFYKCNYCHRDIGWRMPKLYRTTMHTIHYVCKDPACIEKAKTASVSSPWQRWS